MVTERELHPSYYYQVAAAYMTQRKRSFESVIATFEAFEEANAVDVLAGPKDDIGAPLYVGQAPRLLRRGNSPDAQIPTAGEFMRHAVAEERAFSHSVAAIELLTKAHEQYKLLQASRMIYYIGGEMGRLYFNARDYKNAMRLFDSVASMYRKEAWVALLGATLGYLQECARQLGLLKEYVEYALELASLPIPKTSKGTDQRIVSGPQVGPAGPLTDSQRVRIFKEVSGLLRGATTVLPARDGEKGLAVSRTQPIMIEIDLVSSLRAVLSACAAFQESTVKPGKPTQLALSLLTHLPLLVEVHRLEVHFNQPECNFLLQSNSSIGGSPSTVGNENETYVLDTRSAKDSYNLALEPDKWKRFVVTVSPGRSGKLECLSVIAHIGPHASIKCQVESAASREEVPLWVFEPGVDLSPVKDSTLAFFGQKVISVEEPEPLANIVFDISSGPAMVREDFPVSLCIRSTGHAIESGELKVYLAPLSASLPGGAGMSTDSAMDGMHNAVRAELLVANSHDAHLNNGPSSDAAVARLDTFSGSMVLPLIGPNESWSASFFVRSLEAGNLSFNASLQYQAPSSSEGTLQTSLTLSKSVQIICEDPFLVTYRYVAGFRRDALMHMGLHQQLSESTAVALPFKETSILVVTAKSSSSVPVRLLSVHVEEQDSSSCMVRRSGSVNQGSIFVGECPTTEGGVHTPSSFHAVCLPGVVLSPGEIFSQLFWVRPLVASRVLQPGAILITWERVNNIHKTMAVAPGFLKPASKPLQKSVQLPLLLVESPPLVVALDCPPYGLLGVPFMLSLKVQNQTAALQELSFSVTDAQSFIFSGAHTDSFSVLPHSTYVLSYRFVPIASGMQQLPHVQLTSSRFSARFQSSPLGTQLFIYPTAPSDPQALLR